MAETINSRVGKLEADMGDMDNAIREHFAASHAFVVETLRGTEERLTNAFADALRTTEKRLSDRIDSVEGRLDRHDRRFDQIDARLDRMDARFDKMDARFDKMDERFDKMDERFEEVLAQLDEIRKASKGS